MFYLFETKLSEIIVSLKINHKNPNISQFEVAREFYCQKCQKYAEQNDQDKWLCKQLI